MKNLDIDKLCLAIKNKRIEMDRQKADEEKRILERYEELKDEMINQKSLILGILKISNALYENNFNPNYFVGDCPFCINFKTDNEGNTECDTIKVFEKFYLSGDALVLYRDTVNKTVVNQMEKIVKNFPKWAKKFYNNVNRQFLK